MKPLRLATLALLLGLASLPAAAKPKPVPASTPAVVERAITLGHKDRLAAIALLEDFCAENPPAGEGPIAALYAGEYRRLVGDNAVAKAWFQQVIAKNPDSPAKDGATLGIALINAEEAISGNIIATLQLLGEKNIPDTMNADRFRLLARDGADQGMNPTKVREYVKKAIGYAEGDPAMEAKIRGSLADMISESQAAGLESEAGTVSSEEDAIRRIKEALQAGRRPEAARQARQFLDSFPSSPRKAEAESLLHRAESAGNAVAGKVAVLLPLSGSYSSVGKQLREAIELANRHGGNKLSLSFIDTVPLNGDLSPKIESLVQDGVVGMLGPVLKEDLPSASQAAQAWGLPMISLSQSEDAEKAGEFVFRGFVSVEDQVEALVEHAMGARGMRSFAILHPGNGYGDRAAEVFANLVTKRGGTIVRIVSYEENANDFLGPAQKLRGGRASRDPNRASQPISFQLDGIFVPDSWQKIPLVASALAYEEVPVGTFRPYRGATPIALMGLNGWNNARIAEAGGQYLQRAVFVDAFDPNSDAPGVGAFVNSHKDATGRAPKVVEALAYDAARLMGVATLAGGPDRDAVRKELAHAKIKDPVAGGGAFGEDRSVARDLIILTIEGDHIRQWQPRLEEP